MYIIFVCFTSKILKWLLLLLYTHPHPSFLGNVLHLGAYVYNALEKMPTNIFMSFSSKLNVHVEHNQRGVRGQFLCPISQELYIPFK
jgi:hypothetical protein